MSSVQNLFNNFFSNDDGCAEKAGLQPQLNEQPPKPSDYSTWRARLNKLIDEVDDRYRELDRKEAVWKKALELVRENHIRIGDRIVLDVGGMKFATYRQTLLRFDDTYFTILLGVGNWTGDTGGRKYFIDRNPKGFDLLLDYLRDGTIELGNLTPADQNRFVAHCEYFKVPIPESLRLEWSTDYCARQLQVSDGKILKTQVGPLYRYSGALATLKNPPRFRVKVLSRKKGCSLLIGLVPRSSYVDETVSLQAIGYFMDVATGNTLKCVSTEKNDIFKYRNRKIREGSIVEVRFDSELKQISFRVDDNDYGVAFTLKDLPEPLYPAIELHSVGDCVELF